MIEVILYYKFHKIDDPEQFYEAMVNGDFGTAVDSTGYTDEEVVEFLEYQAEVAEELSDAVDEDAVQEFAEEYGLFCPYQPDDT